MPTLGLAALYVTADRIAERNNFDASSDEASSSTASATGLLSLRRAPTALAADATEQTYRFLLDGVISDMNDQSCLAVEWNGTEVVDVRTDQSVVPASNLKLFVAAAALEVLGADYVFSTRAAGNLVGDTVDGDLYLIGGGDATLSTQGFPETQKYQDPLQPYTPLDQLADRLVAKGLRHISGRVVGDESRYDTQRFIPDWQSGIAREEGGPLSALLVNDGLVSGNYAEANAAGELPIDNPATTAAGHLQRLLIGRGVTIGNSDPTTVSMPAGTADIESISSPPLSSVLSEMLETSDNNTAELMLKELGLARRADPTTAGGIAVVTETLAAWGVPLAATLMVDGSGLSDKNRVTCAALIAVLDHLGPAGPVFDGLPIAGESGTLHDVFEDSPIRGRLHAKTGTLSTARALSGYVSGAAAPITFSLVYNGPNAREAALPLWDRLGKGLAVAPAPVDPESLAPAG